MTTPMVFPTRTISIDLDDDQLPETDISSRVVTSLVFENGIFSSSDFNRTAGVGTLAFSIDNSDGAYINASTLIGRAVNIVLTYGYLSKQVWYGQIKRAKIDDGDWGDKRVHISAVDWMSVAQGKVIQNVRLATDKSIDEAIPFLLVETAIDPAHLDLDEGYETFAAVFDGIKKRVTVYSELDKLTKSELGWTYLQHRATQDGVTLRTENFLSRGINTPLATVPTELSDTGFLKFHGLNGETGYIKQHTASDEGKIKIHTRETAAFNATLTDGDWDAGEGVVNDVSVKIYPRSFDDSPIVLFLLDEPIYIGQTQRKTINGKFYDPDTDQEIPAFNVITPVAFTDYFFDASSSGTGPDYTSNLTGSFAYNPGGWRWSVFNQGNPGYVWYFQVRGYGIHKGKPIEYQNDNTQSAESIMRESLQENLTREYSTSYETSQMFADNVLAMNRYPAKKIHSASFIANTNESLLSAYMTLEQGDKVQIVTRSPNHTGSFYIQAVRSEIDLGGVVDFTWFLKESVETFCEPITVAAPTGTASGIIGAVDFGVLPYIANMPAFTYSAWVRRRGLTTQAYLLSHSLDVGTGRRGNYLSLNEFGTLSFSSYKTPGDGFWWVPGAFTAQNTWKLVTVTYNNSSDGADPKIYLDDQALDVVETSTPSGTTDDDSDCPLIILNIGRDPINTIYSHDNLADVDIKLPRIWNRELTPSEIRELYRNPNNFNILPDGKVFQGIYVPIDNRAGYISANITDQDLLLDAVHGAVGTPYNQFTADSHVLRGRELT